MIKVQCLHGISSPRVLKGASAQRGAFVQSQAQHHRQSDKGLNKGRELGTSDEKVVFTEQPVPGAETASRKPGYDEPNSKGVFSQLGDLQLQSLVEAATPDEDKHAYQAPFGVPAFTRRREVIVGRVAMLGMLAAVLGELLSGKGVLGQLQAYTGLPLSIIEIAFWLASVGFVGASLNPWGPTFSRDNVADFRKRMPGPLQQPWINPFLQPRRFFGTSEGGFTKANEVFHGRLAMVAFMAVVAREHFTRVGPLGQLGIDLGNPIVRALTAVVLVSAVVAILVYSFTGHSHTGQDSEDMY